jgi:acyl-homoserine-lactone acylase
MRHVIWAVCVVLLVACSGRSETVGGVLAAGGSAAATPAYDSTVTRTAMGIPHVKANDWGSLGYGLGYAFAEDNLCVLMEDLVTIRGERAKYFGGSGSYAIYANSSSANNVDSDFFWKLIATPEAVNKIKAKTVNDAKLATSGYKDGLNRYIRELKAGQHPGRHASCASQPWLAEISDDDMYRRYYRLVLLASSSVFAQGIGTAQPPATPVAMRSTPKPLSAKQLAKIDRSQFPFSRELPIGSNMYAIGPAGTENGSSIQFVNPHFPWQGTERLYMSHLTLPGKMDIMGSSLYGVPAILIGFNDKLAWSHTVSSAYRFTFYELTLVPGDPTSYVYNGATMKMTAVPLSVEVKQDDGKITKVSRTLYKSKFGPMLTYTVSGVNILPWTGAKAYTLRDANAENDRLINQFFAWDQAKSLEEFKALHGSILGVPWVNTIATGPGGKAYYGDVTVVPNVPDAKVQACSTSAQAQALSQLAPGLPLLDGSRTDCEWATDADAPAPGIFGPANLPKQERNDWVANNNDSYWLTNPAQPIEGYAKIIGPEKTARSLRTRHAIIKMLKRFDGTDGLGNVGNNSGVDSKKWTTERLKQSVLDSRIYSADLTMDDVQSSICAAGTVMTGSGPVDVKAACTVLKNWDRSNNLDSKGAHLWREFWRNASANPGLFINGTRTALPAGIPVLGNWTTPFSASDPVNTPRGLDVLLPTVQSALGDAVNKFAALKIPLDKPLGEIQHSGVNGDDISIFGGEGNMEGAFTIARGSLTDKGYGITYGNSHVSVITWDANGAVADAFITYSQSTDPANPHFNDFTKAYSAKQWQRLPFHDADVSAAAQSVTRLTQ